MQTTLKRTGHSNTQSSDSVLFPVLDITEDIWKEVAPLVQRVIDRVDSVSTLEGIKEDLESDARQLWIIRDKGEIQAMILTMIENYKDKRVGVITHAAGEDFRAWESAVDPISKFFKSMSCGIMRISGRRGWKKFLENRDFREITTNFERKL